MSNTIEVFDTQLIELIESYSYLYDKKQENHKDKVLCGNTWNSISAQLKVSVDDAMKRWKSLRDKFSKIRRDKKNTPSGSGQEEINSPLYKSLLFLEPYVRPRATLSNFVTSKSTTRLESVHDDNGESQDSQESQDLEEEFIDDLEVKEFLSQNSTERVERSPSSMGRSTPSSSRSKRSISSAIRQNRSTDLENHLITVLGGIQQTIADTNKDDSKDDPELNFCLSVYGTMKRMSKRKKKDCRFQIAQILHQLESDSE